MSTTIFVRKITDGWQVARAKTEGLNKGTTVLATTCNGHAGKIFAADVARKACLLMMADDLAVIGAKPKDADDMWRLIGDDVIRYVQCHKDDDNKRLLKDLKFRTDEANRLLKTSISNP